MNREGSAGSRLWSHLECVAAFTSGGVPSAGRLAAHLLLQFLEQLVRPRAVRLASERHEVGGGRVVLLAQPVQQRLVHDRFEILGVDLQHLDRLVRHAARTPRLAIHHAVIAKASPGLKDANLLPVLLALENFDGAADDVEHAVGLVTFRHLPNQP